MVDNRYALAVTQLATGLISVASHNFIKIFLEDPILRGIVVEEVGKSLVKEVEALCSTNTPSILRDTKKISLEELDTEKIVAELQVS